MIRKILDGLTIFSFTVVVLGVGAGTYSYFWITNEDNQKMLQDKAMEKVMGSIKMPSLSGGALPTPSPSKSLIPKF
tara:strand:+ start:180 stop:407 length:228 start_codon:yes stop_codon:yes gene_type:complete